MPTKGKAKTALTATRLRELLNYDAETGLFRWRVNKSSVARVGDVAGTRTIYGYWQICVDGRQYRAHRLAWLWMTGNWPTDEIDHKDGARSNNRWINLREATGAQNKQNRRVNRRTLSGLKGVAFDRRRKKWLAQIRVNGRLKSLGRFSSSAEAASAYAVAAYHYFREFARVS